MNQETLKRRIDVASKRMKADLVIKNAQIVDVFNQNIIHGDLAIVDGVFVGIGDDFDGKEVIDAQHRFVAPSFIDGHVHIESSMVTPTEFTKVVVPHGVTTVVTDPHEIANVSGKHGIQFMIDDARDVPIDIHFMLPSSVPATPFENAGAELKAKDLVSFYDQKIVRGLAEVMDYPSVLNADEDMVSKLVDAINFRNQIDGHAAGLDADAINVYKAVGISTDHECTNETEALQRIQRGLYVMIRQGSAARDLPQIIGLVNQKNARRFLFCTDDKHLDDLLSEGSIDHNVRLAIKHGLDPILAIQLASINAAECFHLQSKGAIAPGYDADFLILDDLNTVAIKQVFKSGKCIAENGKMTIAIDQHSKPTLQLMNTVNMPEVTNRDLQISMGNSSQAHVIEIIPNSLLTKKRVIDVPVINKMFQPSIKLDLLKLAVVERHHYTGNIGLGIVNGLTLKHGAIATTVGHDSHNIIAAGTNDDDLVIAINEMKQMNGGLIVVNDGVVQAALPLPIAGLISDSHYIEVNHALNDIDRALRQLEASKEFNIFLTLSFLSLPVIPEIKLTDMGLFDVTSFSHIPVVVNSVSRDIESITHSY